jgi:hypothetical protein
MRAVYCRSLAGFLIRAGDGFNQWSHGGIVMPDNSVINARPLKGVVRESWDDFVRRYSAFDVVEKECPDDAAGYQFAAGSVGRIKYGYGDFLNAMTTKLGDWTGDDESAHCIQFQELAFVHAGRVGPLRRFENWVGLHRITPHQGYITK